jgi:hypothetical protein
VTTEQPAYASLGEAYTDSPKKTAVFLFCRSGQRKIMDETRAAEAERYLRANDPESATILARTGGAEAGGFAARAHRRM